MADAAKTSDASHPEPLSTEARMIRRVRQAYVRIIQGKAAANRWEVKAHRGIRIASIILSSLGSAGVIADKVTGNTSSWAFVGAMMVLGFGIFLQIANEFRIDQIATDARSLAEACGLCELQLSIILENEDPRRAVTQLYNEVKTIILKHHKVLSAVPTESEVDETLSRLIDKNRAGWHLPERERKPGRRSKRESPPRPAPKTPPSREEKP